MNFNDSVKNMHGSKLVAIQGHCTIVLTKLYNTLIATEVYIHPPNLKTALRLLD